jgi:hypothetical protein
MPFTIIQNGQKEIRYLLGPRPFSELLTHEELLEVECGNLVGINSRGGVLALSSPLEDGAEVILSNSIPETDIFGVPANKYGELVGMSESREIQKYEKEHEVCLWNHSLIEIRDLLICGK